MVQNVRAYILKRQEQMQRIVSYISFQKIPGEQPGIFCASKSGGGEESTPEEAAVAKSSEDGVQGNNNRLVRTPHFPI